MRIGSGFDVHCLQTGRKLVLGGVDIPHTQGLLGHSDADVLVHAICDALLGAAALGDIGQHFPDTDSQYKNVSSLYLLGRVKDLLDKAGFLIGNIDSTIVAQKPRLAPYIFEMRSNIAAMLNITIDQISVKATTSERLGFEGREEGISAQAVVLLEDK
ncbi:MAG: 2-C-methyl-D-erythritol 2,4-cyclodiphosphate synthase [Syntrophomonadaceae bacterium]|nr:2-C-methyl-D-erythritol 2,4-cyclodiphosphate synthase [Syntrophomonadaceae bacterium]MDD3899379.1 2-C-methyl-D-erythritol 2,4-cyclodiphosphate synthase [Syntrophomonadaceae bacterium]